MTCKSVDFALGDSADAVVISRIIYQTGFVGVGRIAPRKLSSSFTIKITIIQFLFRFPK